MAGVGKGSAAEQGGNTDAQEQIDSASGEMPGRAPNAA